MLHSDTASLQNSKVLIPHSPGEQYQSDKVKNPFDERVVSNYTAQNIATLQSRLNKQLGPEYLSNRKGHGGTKVWYLEGNKAIALANEVFGFNGWSSSLQQVQVDFVCHPSYVMPMQFLITCRSMSLQAAGSHWVSR